MTDLEQYLPQPTTWFERTLDYSGKGRIEFASPSGWVEGMATCTVNEVGNLTISLVGESWVNNEDDDTSTRLSFDRLLSGVQIQSEPNTPWVFKFPLPAQNRVISLTILVDSGGKFTSDSVMSYSWDSTSKTIKLDVVDLATYTAPDQHRNSAKYWVLPCVNLVMDTLFGSTIADRIEGLARHPLRLISTPQKTYSFLDSDAPTDQKSLVRRILITKNYVVDFLYHDELAFIERLPDYANVVEDLKCASRVTSVMVGTCVADQVEFALLGLLAVLGVGVGCPISPSWIEYRDAEAKLVCRMHANFGRYRYRRGHRMVLNTDDQGGLGRLLSDASRSSALSDKEILGSLINCAHALSEDSAEKTLYYVCSSFDELFGYFKLKDRIPAPLKLLSEAQAQEITRILGEASIKIEKLKSTAVDETDKQNAAIETIAQNTRSQPLNKTSRFADQLHELINYLGFADAKGLNVPKWKKAVGKYRSKTIHETNYGDIFDPDERESFWLIYVHLLDLLVRTLLKTLNYSGTYYSLAGHKIGALDLDWVRSARDLGYEGAWLIESK